MAATNQPEQPQRAKGKPKKKLSLVQRLLIILFIIIVVIVIISIGITSLIKSVQVFTHAKALGAPSMAMTLSEQDLLSYQNGTQFVPYTLFNYNTNNVTNVYMRVTLYAHPPPTTIYILNWSNECAGCGNVNQFISSLDTDLANYSVFNSTNQVQIVSASAVTGIKPNSVLIIPNGYLPSSMLNTVGNTTIIQTLLNSGTTIIYIGKNFSRLITSQSVLVPDVNPPSFLSTVPVGAFTGQSSFFFNQTTFYFPGTPKDSPISYEGVSSGYIIAFSNFMDSWKSPQDAAADVSLVISQAFWISQYTAGTAFFNVKNTTKYSGSIGVLLNDSPLGVSPAILPLLAASYGRAVIEASNNGFSSTNGTIYRTVYFTPQYVISGAIAMPALAYPGLPITSTLEVYINTTQQLEPHIDIYNDNLTFVSSMPPIFSKQVSSNYSFINTFTPSLPPGSYIAQLNGFSGQHYGSAYFVVPGINFALTNINFSLGTYTFQAAAAGIPVNNETANILVNGQYKQSVYISNGGFTYTLPIGVTPPSGNLTFSINASGENYQYATYFSPPSVTINKQYIEFIIAIIIVILEITLVKAPTRDDFYIDVPNMPEPEKANVKIKSVELLNVFDKLNLYYHWRYMPLSNTEFRFAISSNLRVASMPVTPTYNNVDIILDSLAAKGLVVSIDGLYAPRIWIDQSKHDIEYLAVFKKLRVYLVSNAHIFTDLDKSDVADIVTTFHNEKAYIIIYSKTSRFLKNIPVQPPIKTYMAFLNADKLEEFKQGLYMSASSESEQLKMYIATGSIVLLDADNPGSLLI